jgi:hypothetical protein
MFDGCLERSALWVAALVYRERRGAATLSCKCYEAYAPEEIVFRPLRGNHV